MANVAAGSALVRSSKRRPRPDAVSRRWSSSVLAIASGMATPCCRTSSAALAAAEPASSSRAEPRS
jgi:hypothetical protein